MSTDRVKAFCSLLILALNIGVLNCCACGLSTKNEISKITSPVVESMRQETTKASRVNSGTENEILENELTSGTEDNVTQTTALGSNETEVKEALTANDNQTLLQPIITSLNIFGWKFLNAAYNEKAESTLFSPVSLYTILTAVQAMARGKTRSELQSLTGLDNPLKFGEIIQLYNANDSGKFTFKSASAAYINKGLMVPPQIRETFREKFAVELLSKEENLSSRELTTKINKFIEEKTEGQIQNFLKEVLDPKTVLLLLNAVYMKGVWVKPIDQNATKPELFKNLDGTTAKIPMMHMDDDSSFYFDQKRNFMVAEIPYVGNISMFIIVPLSSASLSIRQLFSEDLDSVFSNIGTKKARVSLPKFKMSQNLDLVPILEDFLNIKTLFVPADADLSGVAKGLYASGARHSVVLDVNEKGTKASGATIIGVESRTYSKDFRVNRPFLAVIRDKLTGANLFYGAINKFENPLN